MTKFKKKIQEIPLQKEIKTSKSFHYEKDGVELNFTLNTDNNKQSEAFHECLSEALIDVNKLL